MEDTEGLGLQGGDDAAPAAPAPAPEPAPAPKGLDAIIDSAISKLEGQSPDSPLSHDRELDRLARSDTSNRDPKTGRFTPKDLAAQQTSQEPTAAAALPADQITPVDPASQQSIDPHPRWSDADKAVFAKLPRDAQSAWLESYKRQEADYTRKTQEVAETRKAIEPLLNSVGQWSSYLQQLNLTPHQAFDQMLRTEFTLRTGTPQQKQDAIAYLQQLYGISSASGQPVQQQQQAAEEWVDPHVLELRKQVQSFAGVLQGMQQQSRHFERSQAQAEFDAIGQTKDETGNPKYPHWARVKDAMIHMVANGFKDEWDGAYRAAVLIDPELQSQFIEAERKRAVETIEKQRQEAVQRAKGAAPVQASHATPRGATKMKGLDAHLDAALSAAGVS